MNLISELQMRFKNEVSVTFFFDMTFKKKKDQENA